MKLFATLLIFGILFFAVSVSASSGSFDWTDDFNHQARINPTGFRASLTARFGLGSVETRKIISRADSPADAYIILRLAEMSGKTPSCVLDHYKENQGEGGDSLARSLDIKSRSDEFNALMEDHDLHGGASRSRDISFSPDRAMLIMLTRSLCMVEAENRALW